MIKSILLLVLTLCVATTFASVDTRCYGYNESVGAVFTIDTLSGKNGNEYEANVTAGTLRYNFCDPTTKVNKTLCGDGNYSAAVQNSDNGTCFKLTNGTIPKFYAQDVTKPLGGVFLIYPAGDYVQGAQNITYNYTVALSCVDNMTYNLSSVNVSGDHNENYLLVASADQGCPVFAFYQLTNFISKFKFAFIIAGIVIGIFLGFFGLRLFKPTLFLSGFVSIFLLMAFILFTFALGRNPSPGAQWGCLIGALVLGILAGILLVFLEKVGIFFLGASLGTSGSFLLYSLILSHLNASNVVLILFTVASALICGIVALYVYEHVIIISTALGGAYLAIRAVSLFAPSKFAYPNEFQIAKEIEYNGFSTIPGMFYVYFSLILVLAVGSGYIQYRHKKTRDEEKAQENTGYAGLVDHQHP